MMVLSMYLLYRKINKSSQLSAGIDHMPYSKTNPLKMLLLIHLAIQHPSNPMHKSMSGLPSQHISTAILHLQIIAILPPPLAIIHRPEP